MPEILYEITMEAPLRGTLIATVVKAWTFEHARQKAVAKIRPRYGDVRVINWRKLPAFSNARVKTVTYSNEPEAS